MWTCHGSNSYSGFFAASQAFDAGKLGTAARRLLRHDRTGADQLFLTSGWGAVPSLNGAIGNKTFSREGFVGLFYLDKLDFQVVTQHGSDNAYFGPGRTGPPVRTDQCALPAGARAPTWNGYIGGNPLRLQSAVDLHSAFGVGSGCRSRRLPTNPSNLGNIDMYMFGYRYMPIHDQPGGLCLA